MARTLATMFSLFLLFSVCWAAGPGDIKDQKDKDSYTLGYTFGKNIRKGGIDLEIDVILQAVRDAFEAREPAMSQDEISQTLSRLEEQMRIAQKKQIKESTSKNLEEGKTFLDKNKEKQGVKTFPSGLQYKVLAEGNGPSPKASDTVTVNYRGSLLDGTLFDSSYTRGKPATMRVDGVIKGWTEALQHMKTGSKWEIFIPPELGYGARQINRIPPNSTLVFELELLSIAEPAPEQAPSSKSNQTGKGPR